MAKPETGPECVKRSTYVGSDVGAPMPEGFLGKPLAKGTTTMTARASDNSGPPSMTHDINVANDRQRRGASVYMPTKGTRR